MKKILIFIAVIIVIFLAIIGYVVFESYQIFKNLAKPEEQNQTATTTQSQNSTTASVYPSKDDLIKVTNILPNQKINSPITIKGEARGNWYFEASFPIRIINERGQVIGSATGIAQEDWMSENYVPFTSIIEFSAGTSTSGTIILQKDNPSGLSQYDNELEIPIQF